MADIRFGAILDLAEFRKQLEQIPQLVGQVHAKTGAIAQQESKKSASQAEANAKKIETLTARALNVARFAEKQNLDIIGRTVQKREIELDKIRAIQAELKRVGATEQQLLGVQQQLTKTADQWSKKVEQAKSGAATPGGFEGFSILQQQLQALGGSLPGVGAATAQLGTVSAAVAAGPIVALSAGLLGAAAGAAAYVAAITTATLKTADQAFALQQLAGDTDATVSELGALQAAITGFGANPESLEDIFLRAGKAMVEADKGAGRAAASMEKLGITQEVAKDKIGDNATALDLILKGLAAIPPGSQKSTAALKIFGDQNAKIVLDLADFEGGIAGIEKAMQRFNKAPQKNIETLANLHTTVGLIQGALGTLATRIAENYAPQFLTLAKYGLAGALTLQDAVPNIVSLIDKTTKWALENLLSYIDTATFGMTFFARKAAQLAGKALGATAKSGMFGAEIAALGNLGEKYQKHLAEINDAKGPYAALIQTLNGLGGSTSDAADETGNLGGKIKKAHEAAKDFASDPLTQTLGGYSENVLNAVKQTADWRRQFEVITKGEPWVKLQERLEEIAVAQGELGFSAETAQVFIDDAQKEYQEALDKTKGKVDDVAEAHKKWLEQVNALKDGLSAVVSGAGSLLAAGGGGALTGLMQQGFAAAGPTGMLAQGALSAVGFDLNAFGGAFEGLTQSQVQQQTGVERGKSDQQISDLQAKLASGEITQEAFDQQVAQIEQAFSEAAQGIREKSASFLIDKALSGIPEAVQKIGENMPVLVDGLVKGLNMAIAVLPDALTSLITQIIQALPALLSQVPELATNLLEIIVNVLSDPATYDALSQAALGIVAGLISNLPQITAALIKAIALAVPALWLGLAQGIIRSLDDLWEGLKAGFSSLADAFISPIEEVINFIIDAINTAIDVVNLIPGVEIGDVTPVDMTKHNGGVVWEQAHNGKMFGDESMVKIRRGEAVLSPQGVASMGGKNGVDSANNGNGGGVQPIVVQQVYNNRVLHQIMYDQTQLAGPLRSQINKNSGIPGFRNIYAKAG